MEVSIELPAKYKKDQWKSDLSFRRLLLNDTFPNESQYPSSQWAIWENRIKKGQEDEDDFILELQKKLEQNAHSNPERIFNDIYGDDFWEAQHLSNLMYAALIVSLWSKMEEFLKSMVGICIGALKLSDKVRYEFGAIKYFFKTKVSLDFELVKDYKVIDAIRILNNSFKHNGGFYAPEYGKSYTQIDSSLLDRWNFGDRFVDRNEIDYCKLPISELVTACHIFCHNLISAITAEMERLVNGQHV